MKNCVLIALSLALAGCAQHIEPVASSPVVDESVVAKSPQELVDTGGPLRFAIIGDRTGGHRPDIFGPALSKIDLLQPDLVMSVGDFIEGYTEDTGVLDDQWGEVEQKVENLRMPLFYVTGNHDMGNRTMLSYWHDRRGPTYYAFRYKGALFLALNTEDPPIELEPDLMRRTKAIFSAMQSDPAATQERVLEATRSMSETPKPEKPAQFSDDQIAFIKQALADNVDVRWTFVFMHKPAWNLPNTGFDEIEALLQDRDYTVFAGHEHYYAYERRKGRDYVDLATTGGIWLKDGPGRFDHITWVTLADEGPQIANIAVSGISGKEGPEAQPSLAQ